MKAIAISSLIFLMGISCVKNRNPRQTQDNLEAAMDKYLASEKDTHEYKFKVLDVLFFEDKKDYKCEYKVRMTTVKTGKDTVGVMTADVSKDFEKVKRKS